MDFMGLSYCGMLPKEGRLGHDPISVALHPAAPMLEHRFQPTNQIVSPPWRTSRAWREIEAFKTSLSKFRATFYSPPFRIEDEDGNQPAEASATKARWPEGAKEGGTRSPT